MISYQTVKFMKMLAVGAMSISCLITPVLAAQSATQMPNIPMPTLGGKQVWADEYVYAGWRIQQNIYTKHFRLLDPLNTRRAWGDFEACKSALDEVRVKTGLKPKSSHMVLLVHGIARSTGTFSQMQETWKSVV